MFLFYTPWKHQKNFGFLVFSRVIKWEHWNRNNFFRFTVTLVLQIQLTTEGAIFLLQNWLYYLSIYFHVKQLLIKCRSSHRRCPIKEQLSLKISVILTESLFLIKLQAFRPLWKRDSSTGVFLWILRNF